MKTAEQQEDDLLVNIGRLSYCANQNDWKRFEMILRAFTNQVQSDAIESCAVSIESEPATSSEQRRRDLYLAAKLRSLIPQNEKKV